MILGGCKEGKGGLSELKSSLVQEVNSQSEIDQIKIKYGGKYQMK